jgi:two-component system chemotaxis response regulator CheB
MSRFRYKAIAIGASAGGITACRKLLTLIDKELNIPVFIVQHIKKDNTSDVGKLMSELTGLEVIEPESNTPVLPYKVYLAPADYHMVIEQDKTISLLSSEPVNYSRPSIDVLFESAAEAYGEELIGIILSGSSCDGTKGILRIEELGGCTVVQNPDDTEFNTMPFSAMARADTDFIGSIEEIAQFLKSIISDKN